MAGLTYLLSGRLYDFLDEHFEKTRYETVRKKILPHLKGKVLDAGCGTGRNFPYYSESAYVLAVDNSESMLKAAKQRLDSLKENKKAKNIEIKNMDLTKINLPKNSVDSVVATFVLCTMPEKLERIALKELIRVAKPGAKMYFLEYIYSKNPRRRLIMKLTAFLPKLLYGIRFNSTLPVIREENQLIIEKNELVYDDVLRLIIVRKKKDGLLGELG